MKPKTTISKLEQIRMGRGPMLSSCRGGSHRDFKRNPKGGKACANRKAIREFDV